jgi:redox-sensitive bicupin YhaK (pirin superfamily)
MLHARDRGDRGKAEMGWLSSRHTFSFGQYRDPKHMGFRALRVINEDRVIPGAGFPTHSHSDMEIISYVLEGALEHKDSLGTGAVIRPGEIQRMSAGAGVQHSEFNASSTEPVHFLQMWVIPEAPGLQPSYEQKALPPVAEGESRLDLIGSRDGREGSVVIHQDVALYRATIAAGGSLQIPLAPGRHAWVQVARGIVEIEDGELREGDGLAVSDAQSLTMTSGTGAEVLVFDLA